MGGKTRETCGRCSMTSVVGAVENDEEGGDGHNPFDGARIEVPEAEMRKLAKPQIWLGRLKHRLDEVATRLTYGDPR